MSTILHISHLVHDKYTVYSFAMQAVHDKHREKMDSPSNGVSIVGYLRPAFIEEESYLRSLFHGECNGDGYSSDWRGNSLLYLGYFC